MDKKSVMKSWTHISIEDGRWIKRWFEQEVSDSGKKEKDPACVGSISMPLEAARRAGL